MDLGGPSPLRDVDEKKLLHQAFSQTKMTWATHLFSVSASSYSKYSNKANPGPSLNGRTTSSLITLKERKQSKTEELEKQISMLSQKISESDDQLQEKVTLISKKLEQSEEKIHTSETEILELQNSRPAHGKSLDEDMFSIMMTSKLCSLG